MTRPIRQQLLLATLVVLLAAGCCYWQAGSARGNPGSATGNPGSGEVGHQLAAERHSNTISTIFPRLDRQADRQLLVVHRPSTVITTRHVPFISSCYWQP